jgi:riboflavin synthase
MFTGIIEEIGEITAIAPAGDGWRLTVRAPKAVADAVHGESIAVSGVCLTVVDSTADTFDADVMKQTLDVAALGGATVGTRVNIEKAMPVGARLGGHIVQGHVDAVGEIVRPVPDLEVRMPADLLRYVVPKGSITVDGVSLTVVDVLDDGFTVAVIPHTAEVTTLGRKGPGDRVNLEVDVMAKHVERLMEAYKS